MLYSLESLISMVTQRGTNATEVFVSGTKYEGNKVSTIEKEGLLKNLRSTIDDEKGDLKMNIIKTTDKSSDNHRLLLSPSEMVKEYAIGYTNEENNVSSWLMSPESTASTSTSSSKQHNADVISAPIQSEYRKSGDYAFPTSLNITATQREMWDELRTIETTGSDTFDLLSYLWEVSWKVFIARAYIFDCAIIKFLFHDQFFFPFNHKLNLYCRMKCDHRKAAFPPTPRRCRYSGRSQLPRR